MLEFIGLLCVLIVIGLIIGAGVLFNWLARPAVPATGPAHRFHHCPDCGRTLYPTDEVCPRCRLRLDSRHAARFEQIRIASNEIRRLQDAGTLDQATASRIEDAFAQERDDLRHLGTRRRRVTPPALSTTQEATSSTPEPQVELVAAEPVAARVVVPPPLPDRKSPPPLLESAPPSPPRRTFGEMLAQFMHERNILWGELVGGLLIVGCSVALVLSLWRTLEALPYFTFLLFGGITAAVFGAGEYTLHHWKLTATSRGLLMIALLLTPLNLLLLADPGSRGTTDTIDLVVKLISVVGFAWVVRTAARDLVGVDELPGLLSRRWLLALAVVGAPAMQMIPPIEGAWAFLVPVWTPLACLALAAGPTVGRLSRDYRPQPERLLTPPMATAVLLFVGLGLFALFASWAYLLTRADDLPQALRHIASPVALAGLPLLSAGLLVQRKLNDPVGLKVTGTGAAMFGIVLSLLSLGMGWPDPRILLASSAGLAILLTWMAYRDGMPWLHGIAIPCAILAIVLVRVLFNLGEAPIGPAISEWLAKQLVAPDKGLVLVGMAVLLFVISELARATRIAAHAPMYAVGAAGVGVFSLFVVSVHGTEALPVQAAIVYYVCSLGTTVAGYRHRLRSLCEIGVWLLLPGTLWLLWATVPEQRALWAVVLAGVAFVLASMAGCLGLMRRTPQLGYLRTAGRNVALGAALLAVCFFVQGVRPSTIAEQSVTLFVLTVVAFQLASLFRQQWFVWVGTTIGAFAFVHLTVFAFTWKPLPLAFLVAGLTYATLLLAGAWILRRYRRLAVLYVEPLRWSGQIVLSLTTVLLFIPPEALLFAWAGYAVALGLLWLFAQAGWRHRWGFSLFQGYCTWAACLTAFACVAQSEWLQFSELPWFVPQTLQACLLAVSLLSIMWLLLHRMARSSPRLQAWWNEVTPRVDEVVFYGVLLGQLVLTAMMLVPGVITELTPRQELAIFASLQPSFDWFFMPWAIIGALATCLLLQQRTAPERVNDSVLQSWCALLLTIPLVMAGYFIEQIAVATALRWSMAFTFVIGSIAYGYRQTIRQWADQCGFPLRSSVLGLLQTRLMMTVSAVVVVGLSVVVAWLGLNGETPSGPLADTFFRQMGWIVSNVVPLALVVLSLAGTAYRERSAGYAFVGGLLATATVSGGYALGVTLAGHGMVASEQMRLALFALTTLAVWSLLWLAVRHRVPDRQLLLTNVLLSVLGFGLLTTIPAYLLLLFPARIMGPTWVELGSNGWGVLLLVLGSAWWYDQRSRTGFRDIIAYLAVFFVGVLAACTTGLLDEPSAWLALRVLSITWVVGGVGLVGLLWRSNDGSAGRIRPTQYIGLEVLAVVLAIFSFRIAWSDPWLPYFSGALFIAAALFAGAVGVRLQSRVREYVSSGYFMMAFACAWVTWGPLSLSSLVMYWVLGASLSAIVWTGIAIRRTNPNSRVQSLPEFPYLAVMLAPLGLANGLIPTFAGENTNPLWLGWIASTALAVALVVLCWDRKALHAPAGLLVVGAMLVGLGVVSVQEGNLWNKAVTPVVLAVYVLGVAGLLQRSHQHPEWRSQWRLPTSERQPPGLWLMTAFMSIGLLVLGLSVRTALQEPLLWERFAGPLATALLLPALLLLTRQATALYAAGLRMTVLIVGTLVFGLLGWAVPDPEGIVPWLQRHSWLFVALATSTVVYAILLPRWTAPERWEANLRRVSGVLFAAALVVLAVLIVQQIPQFDPGTKRTPLSLDAVLAGMVGLFMLIGMALRFALRPKNDPLGETQHGRTGYVYLAEVLLVLIFVQVRLNLPELFGGQAVRYWTFIVMFLAFVGVGLAEMFARRHLRVLAIPLLCTGALLPLIPLLIFWAKPPVMVLAFADDRAPGLRPLLGYLEKLPQHYDVYALLWFLAGLLYGLVALSKRSFGWALLGALATNAGLWAILTHNQIPAVLHPQAWAIPLALIVLVSEHVNRARLSRSTGMSLRYLGISMIYISSAADMFIAGIGQSLWLPVVLAALCVLGVLLGMLLRIRAFLYLGSAFLMLDIFAMIWHAAVDQSQTWVWYVSGIILGALIIALFAVLEKRRNSIVGMVERLRTWN